MTSAAAMIFAAASVSARAQSTGLDLRGTDDPPLPQLSAQDQPTDQGQIGQIGANSGDNNDNSANTGANGAPGSGNDQGDGSTTGPVDAPPSPGAIGPVINYGRPKPKRPKLYQLHSLQKEKVTGFPPLPGLTTYKTAPFNRKYDPPPPQGSYTNNPPPTFAVIQPLPHPPKPKPDVNPFDPLGIDVGSLRLFPYIEADTGYDSNPNRLADEVVGSTFVHGETGLKVESQWSQNSLTANLRGGYWDYFAVPLANRPDVAGTIDDRVDVTRRTKINLETRFGLTTQQPGSPLLAIPGSVFITNRPSVMTYGQTAGVSQDFNRLNLDLRGSFDRIVFGDAAQSNGTELLLSQDNFNTYGITGRASYELTPGVIPFVELRGDERRYDSFVDVDGFARNSDGVQGRAGSKFELTHLLTGEISAGYASRTYDDPRLPLLQAPTLDASLIYTATPLTTVTLTAATDLSETTVPFASGAVSRIFNAKVSHALLRDLTLTGTASYQINRYQGVPITEQLYSVGLGLEYHLTRSVVVLGSFTHEQLSSNSVGDAFTDNLFMVGLKLQR
ncbi:MAG: outer membrane beta-barrel protein [Methylovirgula sp.]